MNKPSRSLAQTLKAGVKWLLAQLGMGARADSGPAKAGASDAGMAFLNLAGLPSSPEWGDLVAAHQGDPESVERLATLARGLRALGWEGGPKLLDEILGILADREADEAFLAACEGFTWALADDEFLRTLARTRKEPESAAAAIELARFLSRHGLTNGDPGRLIALVESLTDRAAVKRYAAALDLLAEHGIAVDPLDGFVTSLIEEDAGWLKFATGELGRLGSRIDRDALVRLREVAPDMGRLTRYFRVAQAFDTVGLDLLAIDGLVRPLLEDDGKIAALALIGQKASTIWQRSPSAAEVASLAKDLASPEAVRYYVRAIGMLRELDLPDAEAVEIGKEFSTSREELHWLETFVTRALQDHLKPDSGQVSRVHARCADVSDLYRYLKMATLIEPFTPSAKAALEEMLLEAASSKPRTEAVIEFLGRLAGSGSAKVISAQTIEAAFRIIQSGAAPL